MMEEEDPRFAHIKTDPRFRRLKKKERKVVIDKRFEGMFTDDKFRIKYTVDSRGRPLQLSSNDHLKQYYELSSEESGDENDKDAKSEKKAAASHKETGQSEDESQSGDDEESEEEEKEEDGDSEEEDSEVAVEQKEEQDSDAAASSDDSEVSYDPARGIGVDSSSDTDEGLLDDVPEEEEHPWGEIDRTAPAATEVTSRLAVCNLDWDNIRASDVYVLLSSFTPTGGSIQSVTVYPSQFGLERMKWEEEHGPTELTGQGSNEKDKQVCLDDAEGDDEVSVAAREKLRQYQLNRLKYYYAIVDCDSSNTANHVYDELDGKEFESTATKVDLRFVPLDMKFDHEPRDETKSTPTVYKPRTFFNTALQQAKVRCTWDQTDPDRKNLLHQDFKKADLKDLEKLDADLKAYLASDSEDEEQEMQQGVNKKQLAAEFGEDLADFESAADTDSEIEEKDSISTSKTKKSAEKSRKRRRSKKDWEVENEQDDELALLVDDDDGRQHYNLKKLLEQEKETTKKKKKKKMMKAKPEKTDNFQVDVGDDRFKDIFNNHLYNIDPTAKEYKATAGMKTFIEEKLKRKSHVSDVSNSNSFKKKKSRLS